MANKDTQSRKWLLTINNPSDNGLTHEILKEKVKSLKIEYYCMCDEIGKEGTYHTHLFIYSKNQKRFSTIKNSFPSAHIDKAYGTCSQNRDYVRKEGKWTDTEKKETNLPETFEEEGEIPIEQQGKRSDFIELQEMLENGYSDAEIMESNPRFILHMDKVSQARQILKEEQFKSEFRMIRTTYIYGKTGVGKTRYVMDKFGYENVYRVTDYAHPFDNYNYQDVILFDEFRSSLKIGDMLCYLDGYPLQLPCRFRNKQAAFSTVYIISNIEIDNQYKQIQEDEPNTWRAFLRRINNIGTFTETDKKMYHGYEEYKKITGEEFIDCSQISLADLPF